MLTLEDELNLDYGELTNLPNDMAARIAGLNYGEKLEHIQKYMLEGVLWSNQDVFAWNRGELGSTQLIQYTIDTRDHPPELSLNVFSWKSSGKWYKCYSWWCSYY